MRFLCGTLALISLVMPAVWAEDAAPCFEAAETSCDMGFLLFDKPLVHTFTLHNTGTAPLEVEVTQKSCGCTSDLLEAPTVAPGGTGHLSVGYTPWGDKPKKGPNSFSLVLKTNDPRQPEVHFAVQANLVEEVAAWPETLTLPVATPKDVPLVLDVLCMRRDGSAPHEIQTIEVTPPEIRLVEQERVADESMTRIRYAVEPLRPLPASLEGVVITLRSSSAARPMLEVPVTIQHPQGLQATPSTAVFGVVPAGETSERQVRLSSQGPSQPRQVSSSHELVTAAIEQVEKTLWLLTIRVQSPPDGPQQIKTRVDVMDESGNCLAVVPVLALVGRK
jgi:hypothetical protein